MQIEYRTTKGVRAEHLPSEGSHCTRKEEKGNLYFRMLVGPLEGPRVVQWLRADHVKSFTLGKQGGSLGEALHASIGK